MHAINFQLITCYNIFSFSVLKLISENKLILLIANIYIVFFNLKKCNL